MKVVCTQMDNRLDKANTSTEKANLSFSAETEAAFETFSPQSRKRPLSEMNLSFTDPISAQRKRPKTSGDQEIEVIKIVKESSSSNAPKNLVQSKLKTTKAQMNRAMISVKMPIPLFRRFITEIVQLFLMRTMAIAMNQKKKKLRPKVKRQLMLPMTIRF